MEPPKPLNQDTNLPLPSLDLTTAVEILTTLNEGVALLGPDFIVRWANPTFVRWCGLDPIGIGLFDALNILPEERPSDSILQLTQTGNSAFFDVRQEDRYFHIVLNPNVENDHLRSIVLRGMDTTQRTNSQRKIESLDDAAQQLDSFEPTFLKDLTNEIRLNLIRENLKSYVQNIPEYDVIEIRRYQPETGELIPLLAEGMSDEAQQRRLFARKEGNGVTGYVAATGLPYICVDTANDGIYLAGAVEARSSLTVPIKYHDEVIGTVNVESPQVNAFGKDEQRFTEVFAKQLGQVLHTLNLLDAQEGCAAFNTIKDVREELVLPANEILSTVSRLLDTPGMSDEAVQQSLLHVLDRQRTIRTVMRTVGESVALNNGTPYDFRIKDLHILVVDPDEQLRRTAHTMLERKGCTVESCSNVSDALSMMNYYRYEVVMMALTQANPGGTALFQGILQRLPNARIVLMQGYRYDPEHTMTNIRATGYSDKPINKPLLEHQVMDRLLLAATALAHPTKAT
ncbi:MAG: GAF domain-containing protein [Zavarzinella sp.]